MSKSVVTSRRSFIKGAVAGAVSAGVAPVMALCLAPYIVQSPDRRGL